MAEQALDKRAVISVLTKSHHVNLTAYVAEARPAAERDPDFFARLVAWNHVKGQVRDARVALPIIALAGTSEGDYLDNALAHLADLGPREFVRALKFARETQTHSNELRRLVTRYLRDLERGPRQAFEGIAIQHREPLRYLYTVYHVKPSGLANQAIVQGNGGFAKADVLKRLSGMTPLDAALTVVQHKIPFLVARGALGKAARDTDVLLALIERMSTTELVTNMKWLESAGVKTVPALRAALEAKLAAAAVKPAKSQALKANRAAEALAGDEKLSSKLHALQEKQIDKLGGIDGN